MTKFIIQTGMRERKHSLTTGNEGSNDEKYLIQEKEGSLVLFAVPNKACEVAGDHPWRKH